MRRGISTREAFPYHVSPQEQEAWVEESLIRGGLTAHRVRITTWRGFQTCSFPGCVFAHDVCPHSHTDWTITNQATGQSLSGPGLLGRLAVDHGFFEGPGTQYRVEPEALARVLGPLR